MGPSSCCPSVLPEHPRPLLGPLEELAACTLVQPDSSGGSHWEESPKSTRVTAVLELCAPLLQQD